MFSIVMITVGACVVVIVAIVAVVMAMVPPREHHVSTAESYHESPAPVAQAEESASDPPVMEAKPSPPPPLKPVPQRPQSRAPASQQAAAQATPQPVSILPPTDCQPMPAHISVSAKNLFEFGRVRLIDGDKISAYKWFYVASLQCVSEARSALQDIEKKMDKGEIVGAQRLAQDWLQTEAAGASHADDIDEEIPVRSENGTFFVKAVVDGAFTMDFTIDSGASVVQIPLDIVKLLTEKGQIRPSDYIGDSMVSIADGSKHTERQFRIHSIKVGNREAKNIIGITAAIGSPLLLGQSFLTYFRSWSIDNKRGMLLLH